MCEKRILCVCQEHLETVKIQVESEQEAIAMFVFT